MAVCGFLVKILLWIVTLIYDLITVLFFMCFQQPQPHVKRRENKEKKATCISKVEGGVTYRGNTSSSPLHLELDANKINTMDKVFQYAVKKNGNKKCLGSRQVLDEEDELQKDGKVFKKYGLGDYMWKTYSETDLMALGFSKGLRELGLEPMQKIAILAETRAEWLIAAMAAFRQNLTLVTIYATLGEDAIAHAVKETEVEFILTSHEQLPKFKNVLTDSLKVKKIVYMEDPLKKTDITGFRQGVEIIAFCDVIAKGNRSNKGTSSPTPDDTGIIMYTSGSTGTPKGVLLSHRNIHAAMIAFSEALGPVTSDDVYIGYLPLAHVLELMCEAMCFLVGVPIGYSSALTITDTSTKIREGCQGDASVLRPTIMAGVPLVLDRVYKGIQEKVNGGGCCRRAMFEFFYRYKLSWYYRGYNTPLTDSMIFKKIKAVLGGRVRILAVGGAPLSPDVHEFIRTCLSVNLLQGYGLTETAASTSVSNCQDMSTGRVGGPLSCCDIRLVNWEEGHYTVKDKPNPRGEVLIGGDNVAMGYYKLPEKTATDFFTEGDRRWFRSGDIGEIEEDGCLKIIDRKKDLVKLQSGEYVSLGKVESELKTCPLVDNICVYGDPMQMFIVALVVPNTKQLQALADKMGKGKLPFEQLCADREVEAAVLKEIQAFAVKAKLEKTEIPAALKLCSDGNYWTPDMGLVTAAFKLKRKNIQERYQADIDRMYGSIGAQQSKSKSKAAR